MSSELGAAPRKTRTKRGRLANVALALVGLVSCSGRIHVTHPEFEGGGLLAGARPLEPASIAALSGFFSAGPLPSRLGPEVALRATSSTVSLFGDRSAGYAITRPGCTTDGRLVLEGHWRYPLSSETGLVRLFVGPDRTAAALCRGEPPPNDERLVLRGTTGDEDLAPTQALDLTFERPLADLRGKFFVVGHRGACRTIDDCGVSENSVESIRFAPSMAADVVELDVQVSADGVPFLYHDDAFGPRLSRGAFCHGDVSAFTMAHVRELCTLRYGEAVPTLDEALDAALATPELRAVWLDVKRPEAILPAARAVRRIEGNRPESRKGFRVVLGLGDEALMDRYAVDVPARDVPCLAELDPADVRRLGCMVWGPRWTRGPMRPDVAALQAEGRQVAFWTIDEPEYIGVFLDKAIPNAIVTNRHGLVFLLAQRRAASLATLEPLRP